MLLKKKPDHQENLSRDEILIAEYEYIADTVSQANEDRSRVSSFYFISTGSLVAAILGSQFADGQVKNISWALAVLFLVLTVLGALTLAQLARLRAAWHESVEALNQIKDFYLKQHPDIEPAFKWRVRTIPNTDKPNSIANLLALQVTLLGAVTFGAAIYFAFSFVGEINFMGLAVTVIGAALGFIAQWAWYKHLLVDDR